MASHGLVCSVQLAPQETASDPTHTALAFAPQWHCNKPMVQNPSYASPGRQRLPYSTLGGQGGYLGGAKWRDSNKGTVPPQSVAAAAVHNLGAEWVGALAGVRVVSSLCCTPQRTPTSSRAPLHWCLPQTSSIATPTPPLSPTSALRPPPPPPVQWRDHRRT
jgi:hypothetical protein